MDITEHPAVAAAIEAHGLVALDLIGSDGNAFTVMGNFRRAADRSGWPTEARDAVLAEAMTGDYAHLLATILDVTE